MGLAVAVGVGQGEFLVMAVGGRVCHAINVGQGFGMAEPRRVAQRQHERHRLLPVELRRDCEGAAQDKVDVVPAPVGARRDLGPGAIVQGGIKRRGVAGTGQRLEAPGRQRLAATVDQRGDQGEAAGDLAGGQAYIVLQAGPPLARSAQIISSVVP